MTSDDITGKWIKEAEASGELKRLKGFGKEINLQDDYASTPDELKVAFKVLKNSGYTPPQVNLFKELEGLRLKLAEETDEQERKSIQQQMADKQLKIQMFAEGKAI